MGLSRRTGLRHKATIAPSVPSLAGFYPNGASNTALKTMIARVKASTGRGTIVWKGDSTSIETGAGTGSLGTVGAFAKGLKPTLASLLSAGGLSCLNKALVGDAGLQESGVSYEAYDPRLTLNGWNTLVSKAFAGGGIVQGVSGATLLFTETGVDSFEIVFYDLGGINYGLTIDGSPPAVGPSTFSTTTTTSGFKKVTVRAASVGTHTLGVTPNANGPGLRSIRAFNSTVSAVDIICHASGGARSADQSASGFDWQNLDALKYDAPDLTMCNVVLNDIATGVSVADCVARNAAIINAAKLSGSPLLIFPHPSGGAFEGMASYNAALKTWAAANAVSYFSFWEAFGSPATLPPAFGARLYDGLVHPREELYVEMAGRLKDVIDAMAV